MFFLKELVRTATFPADRAATFAHLLSRLRKLNIQIERENELEGTIVARCLTERMNMVVWRCWNDKVLFELADVDGSRTRVAIYTIPNILRVKVREGETVAALDTVLSELAL